VLSNIGWQDWQDGRRAETKYRYGLQEFSQIANIASYQF